MNVVLLKKYWMFAKQGELLYMMLNKLGLKKRDSDEVFLKHLYKAYFGKELNIKNPVTFNEKLQWLKINDRKSIYSTMVDKYEAKRYVADIIGGGHIIPTLGVWDDFEDINFNDLPNQFVLKCTHDSGSVIICRDKMTFDKASAKQKIKKSLRHNYYFVGREWPYKNVKPRIIAEKYMEDCMPHGDEQIHGLTDYKFFCFNGRPEFLYVSRGLENHPTAEISFYDLLWNEMPFHRSDYKPYHNALMPKQFDTMRTIASTLARNIGSPFVRIDLYSICEQVYFSEITFTPCSGCLPFDPKDADYDLGHMLQL